jgi:LacI family transcriptional regulator
MNIKEFSKLTSYSTATVSRAFANSNSVKKETREKIMKLAEEHNFRPNLAARASFGSATQSIGVLTGSLSTSYFADIIAGIQRELLPKGYLPVIIDSREDSERNAIKRLIDHRVDGMIVSIADQSLGYDELKELLRFNIPTVLLDKDGSGNFDCVHSDELQGGRLAGEHLLKLGHRRIAYAYIGEFGFNSKERLDGLNLALAKENLMVDDSDILGFYEPGIPMMEGLRKKLIEALSRPNRPTAFYAFNDKVAFEICQVSESLGLKVPEDLSVIGHADLNFASMLTPALTTIRQDAFRTGQLTASTLLKKLNGSIDQNERIQHVIPVSLIKRESTSQVPSKIKKGVL